MNAPALLGFAGPMCLLLALAPGPDVLLVIRLRTHRHRGGLAVAAGSAAGSIAWAALVAVGLAALLEQSAEAFRLVRLAGGCCSLYLDAGALGRWARRRPAAGSATGPAGPDPSAVDPAVPGPAARADRSPGRPFLGNPGLVPCTRDRGWPDGLGRRPQFLPAGGSSRAGRAGAPARSTRSSRCSTSRLSPS